jgi:hypothetical protein
MGTNLAVGRKLFQPYPGDKAESTPYCVLIGKAVLYQVEGGIFLPS